MKYIFPLSKVIGFSLLAMLFLWLSGSGVVAQNQHQNSHKLILEINGYSQDEVLWAALYGDEINILDTIHRSEYKFEYVIPFGTLPGVYRLLFDEGSKQLDVVYNNENIYLRTNYEAILDYLEVAQSATTRKFHRFMRAKAYIRYKQRTLNDFLSQFPEIDPFYEKASAKYMKLAGEMNDSIDRITSGNEFLSTLLRNEKEVVPDRLLNGKDFEEFRKAAYFERKDYSDELILRSQLYPDQLLTYLGYYRDPDFTKAQQEEAFATAIDTIIKYTRGNPEVFDFTINYLIEGFKRFGFDELVNHIAERTASEINCINEDRREEMQEKLTRIQSTAIGAKAPALVMKNMQGKAVSLHELKSKKILLVFWASWCPHCMEMLPKLKEYAKKNPEMTVVAVSLDTEEAQWKNAASNYDWIHLSSLNGWETQAVDDYFVYGTPSFFLLNADKTILHKSGTLREVIEFMEAR